MNDDMNDNMEKPINNIMDAPTVNSHNGEPEIAGSAAPTTTSRSDAYYYARYTWELAQARKALSTFEPIANQVVDTIDPSTLNAEDLETCRSWVKWRGIEFAKLKKLIQASSSFIQTRSRSS